MNNMFELIRVWGIVTGLVLAGWYFSDMQAGVVPSQTVAMLVTAIGGFELFLFGQDRWLRRKRRGNG